jgi:4a-hydroxytetrahydrobiopterin dehydratase
MTRPAKLDDAAINAWLALHPQWERSNPHTILRHFTFNDFSSALAFVVRVGMIAERRDHHPDVHLGWGKATVSWSTHDAGGITSIDLSLAEAVSGFVDHFGPPSV